MDNEMINRCVKAATVLNDGYNMLLLKTPINEIVIKVIETMREPTSTMEQAGDNLDDWGVPSDPGSGNACALAHWQAMIDCILND